VKKISYIHLRNKLFTCFGNPLEFFMAHSMDICPVFSISIYLLIIFIHQILTEYCIVWKDKQIAILHTHNNGLKDISIEFRTIEILFY
jgi:hypothetical protein